MQTGSSHRLSPVRDTQSTFKCKFRIFCFIDLAANMIGRTNARRGARRIFAVLQNRRLNQHITYTIIDEVGLLFHFGILHILNTRPRCLLPFSQKSVRIPKREDPTTRYPNLLAHLCPSMTQETSWDHFGRGLHCFLPVFHFNRLFWVR